MEAEKLQNTFSKQSARISRATIISASKAMTKIYEYIVLYTGLAALGIICLTWLPIAIILKLILPERLGNTVGQSVIMLGFRLYLGLLHLLGGCKFDLTELDKLRGKGPVLIAPNHPCLLDAVLICSRLPNIVCIMKSELLDNIFLGAGARLAGYIRNDTSFQMVGAAIDALERGSHLLIFPEGTRTTRPPVNRFIRSLAVIARRAKVPVQTAFIETDSAYLSKNWPLFRKPLSLPINYRVRLGRSFEVPADTRSFTAALESYFAEELNPRPPLPKASGSGTDAINSI